MTEAHNQLFTIELGVNGGLVSFDTVDEIRQWVETEIEFWQWLQKCSSFDSQTSTIWSQHASPWSKINQSMTRLKNSTSEGEKSTQLQTIKQTLDRELRQYQEPPFIQPESKVSAQI